MSLSHKNIIQVDAATPPVVELDSAAHAAYIRFLSDKVSRTVVVDVENCIVTMDLTEKGRVIGVELVGVAEFGIQKLVEKAGIRGVSAEMIRDTRYISANTEPVGC